MKYRTVQPLLLALALGLALAAGLAVVAEDVAPLLDASSGIFAGTDDQGDIQSALEAALADAEAAAGCCDRKLTYEVVGISGRRLAADHALTVTIKASW